MGYGVLLTRAQPFHKGHMFVIEQMLKENDNVLIVIGSANKSGTKRNPLPIEKRKEYINAILAEYELKTKVKVLALNDWSKEDAYQFAKEWGNFFYYNVVNAIGSKTFTIYYNDDVEIIKSWFVDELAERITIKNTERTLDVSSTKVREVILNNDKEYLRYALCTCELGMVHEIRKYLLVSDKEDFIME